MKLTAMFWLVAALLALPMRAPVEAARTARHPLAGAPRDRQLSRDTLAMVGTRAITAADLVQRIEWMPWVEKRSAVAKDSAKVHALQSLVGEALLGQEAHREALGDSGRVARMRASLRKALVRDALYHDVVALAPRVSATEVERIVRRRSARASPKARSAFYRVVADSLRVMGERRLAAQFMGRVLGPQRAILDSATFMLLADSLRSLMAASLRARTSPKGYALLPEDADVMLTRLGPALERPLARLTDGPLSLGDALEDLRLYTFSLHSLEPRHFAVELSARFKDVVAGELMAREGLRRHLEERPEVQQDLEMWTAAWRAHLLLARVAAGPEASEDDAFRRLALFEPALARQICQVDIAEILCDSEKQAVQLRSLLEAGANFDSLAHLFTTRAEWGTRGGRSGFFPIGRHELLGYTAVLSPIGSVHGPVRLPEGYSLFRVLGKRLAPDSLAARQLLEREREQATIDQRNERVTRYLASLAERSNVQINYAGLEGIDVLSANMVTKRLLGFGGGMLAAPSLPPLWNWVPLWRAEHAAVP